MEVVVVENIYLLVIITLLSVLQNGEQRTLQQGKVREQGKVMKLLFMPQSSLPLKWRRNATVRAAKQKLLKEFLVPSKSLFYNNWSHFWHCWISHFFKSCWTFLTLWPVLTNGRCFSLCNMLGWLLQLIATAPTGWCAQLASDFPLTLWAASGPSPASLAHMFWVCPWITSNLGGKCFQTSWGDPPVKDVCDPPSLSLNVKPQIFNKRFSKRAPTFNCVFLSSRNCMDTYPTFLAVMWCAGLCLSQGNANGQPHFQTQGCLTETQKSCQKHVSLHKNATEFYCHHVVQTVW